LAYFHFWVLLFEFYLVSIHWFGVSIIFLFYFLWFGLSLQTLSHRSHLYFVFFFHFWGVKYTFLVAFWIAHTKLLIESLLADTRQIFLVKFQLKFINNLTLCFFFLWKSHHHYTHHWNIKKKHHDIPLINHSKRILIFHFFIFHFLIFPKKKIKK
jgi:hypothetical protein